jgi:hypothetical protein
MNHRPFKSSEPCARCKESERRPYSDYCAPCKEIVTKEYLKTYHQTVRKPRRALGHPEKPKLRGDHEGRFGLKPHRPEPPPQRKPLISEEEQARLDAEASARDRAWHQGFIARTLGLESAPGKPLASKVVTPPPEVWEKLQREFKPQKDKGGMVLPYLMKDIVY